MIMITTLAILLPVSRTQLICCSCLLSSGARNLTSLQQEWPHVLILSNITAHHLGMASATREEAGRLVSRVREGMARILCTMLIVDLSCLLCITQSLAVACLVRGVLKVLCTL